jgi:hypothetical protein
MDKYILLTKFLLYIILINIKWGGIFSLNISNGAGLSFRIPVPVNGFKGRCLRIGKKIFQAL